MRVYLDAALEALAGAGGRHVVRVGAVWLQDDDHVARVGHLEEVSGAPAGVVVRHDAHQARGAQGIGDGGFSRQVPVYLRIGAQPDAHPRPSPRPLRAAPRHGDGRHVVVYVEHGLR